ncbi:C2H2 zinc finger [Ceratobasidium sp. AG-Ba]|nr:C2H2 zinc finger [Ceratobasidium sp. AG-Ba]
MPNNTIICPQCPARFATNDELQHHYAVTHEGAGPSSSPEPGFTCQHCNRVFAEHHWMVQHMEKNKTCKRRLRRWIQLQLAIGRRQATDCVDDDNSIPSEEEAEVSEPDSRSGSSGFEEPWYVQVDEDNSDDDLVMGEERDWDEETEAGDNPETHHYADAIADADEDAEVNPLPHAPAPAPPHPPLREVTDRYGHRYFIEDYHVPTVGEPIRRQTPEELAQNQYPDVGALADPDFFEIAQLLLRSGVSGNFKGKYLRLKKLRGMMPWTTDRAMMQNVDRLPTGPEWSVMAFKVKGSSGKTEIVELWLRDIIEVIKKLLNTRKFGRFLQFKPIKKWTSPARTEQIRDEITTGEWMWNVQAEIKDEYGTVVPVIISSDETRLTNFSGDKKAHPVYITIGNIPKSWRRKTSKRTNALLGYLPVPKLDCEPNKEKRRFHRRDLFHKCMSTLLKPLAEAGEHGIEVPCADGGIRRIYPALAAYIADFPEQCRVACVKQTYCPLCTVKPEERGNISNAGPRKRQDIIDAIHEHHFDGGSAWFQRYGLWDVKPFWEKLPYVDTSCFLTPDLLHQMHKGVIKDHLTKWITHIIGKQAVDDRHSSMPEYHGMRHFKNGISTVSQWTGRELKEMAKVLLPLISDEDSKVVTAARALLDFLYLAHSSSLTGGQLAAMDRTLRTFHENKHCHEPRT